MATISSRLSGLVRLGAVAAGLTLGAGVAAAASVTYHFQGQATVLSGGLPLDATASFSLSLPAVVATAASLAPSDCGVDSVALACGAEQLLSANLFGTGRAGILLNLQDAFTGERRSLPFFFAAGSLGVPGNHASLPGPFVATLPNPFGPNANEIPSAGSATLTVGVPAAVAEPFALSLFGLALAGLVGLRTSRQSRP